MPSDDRKRAYRKDFLLASVMVAAGLVVSGLSLAELATPRSADGAGDAAVAIDAGCGKQTVRAAEPVTTGARPSEIPPQPAQPDADAQKAGATPALPPAPAEKIAAPIKEK